MNSISHKTTEKFYGLDHLRALAIILVFFFHYQTRIYGHPAWVADVGKFGWTGVDLFFVLSGFLISSQLFAEIKRGKSISYKEFFLKRFFRIIPAYWVVVAIYFCFPAFHEREGLSPAWEFLTFTKNLWLDIRYSGTFSHAWSLCVEEHFYFFLPVTLICIQGTRLFKRAWWILAVLFVAGLLLRYFIWSGISGGPDGAVPWYKYIYYPTYSRLDGLLAGVSIAVLYQFLPATWERISNYGNTIIALSIVVLTGAYFICSDEHSLYASVVGFPVVAIGYGLLVLGALCRSCFLYKWNSRLTTLTASLSYVFYLTHKGIIHVSQAILARENIDVNSNLTMFICVIFCVAAAVLLHYLVERPFMKLRHKVLAPKAASTAAVPVPVVNKPD